MVARDGESRAAGQPAAALGGGVIPGTPRSAIERGCNLRVNGDTTRLPRQPHGMDPRSAMSQPRTGRTGGRLALMGADARSDSAEERGELPAASGGK
jgi:hypothetical protein